MIIIFQCYGGTHTSVAAASIYLKRLPRRRVPQLSDLLALPYFDRVDRNEIGTLYYVGCDRSDNPVFVLGSGRWGAQIRALLTRLTSMQQQGRTFLLHNDRDDGVAVIDCFPTITGAVRLGGFLSRRLGLIAIGRPLVGLGILRAYHRFVELVESFEKDPGPYLL